MLQDKKEKHAEISEKMNSVKTEIKADSKNTKNKISIDKARLFFKDEPIKINNDITLYQPGILDIIERGQPEYYGTIYAFCAIPSDYKSMLWDIGIDWNKISDFKFFIIMLNSFDETILNMLFKDFSFQGYKPLKNGDTGEVILFNQESQKMITEDDYLKMVAYVRAMHGITFKREKAKNKFTRDILIQEDRENRERAKLNKKENTSILYNYISAMLVYPGFKYKSNELKQCGIFEFMDAVLRSQVFVSTDALLHGMYSGFCDTKKIPKNDFNWLREL